MKRALILIAFLFLLAAGQAVAQDDGGERSAFLRYVEEQLSTPSMQIRLNGLEGVLSSDVRLESITIADEEGVWLTIVNPSLVWSRSALLRGRVEVDRLAAESIEWSRMPNEKASPPSPEARGFSLPELPVAIALNELDIPSIKFGEPVFGLESEASVMGKLLLDGGSLELDLDIERIDGPGGALKLMAAFDGASRNLALDAVLTEPENGIVANLLNIPDRPPVRLALQGEAPIDDLDISLEFETAGRTVLEGRALLRGSGDGLSASVEVAGPLGSILAEQYRPLFGDGTRLDALALFPQTGGMRLESFNVTSGAINISADAEFLADGFLSQLDLSASVSSNGGSGILLPFGQGGTGVDNAMADISYGEAANGRWTASLAIDGLTRPEIEIASVRLDTAGTASQIADAARRALTFRANGRISGIETGDPAVTEMLRDGILLDAEGNWNAGGPAAVQTFSVKGSGIDFNFSGEIAQLALNGHYELSAGDVAALSAMAGRDISGGISISADGEIAPVTGAFDLAINGRAQELRLGDTRLDKLLAGTTRLSGRTARSAEGLAFEEFQLANPVATIMFDGKLASKTANFNATANLADLAVIDERASGRAELEAAVDGNEGRFSIIANLAVGKGALLGRPLANARLEFEAQQAGGAISGTIAGKAGYAGDTVSLSANVAGAEGTISLSEIDARFGPTLIKGGFSTRGDGLMTADITVSSPDIRSAAAFALADASGALDGSVRLEPEPDGKQAAHVEATARGLVFEGNRFSSADIKADARDLFGELLIDAKIDGRNIVAGGVELSRLDANISTRGSETGFDAVADLQNGSQLKSRGQAIRANGQTDVTVSTLEFNSAIADARLRSPARISIGGGVVRLSPAELLIGDGLLKAGGVAGATLDFELELDRLPLEAVNAVRPDLGLAGLLSGSARVTGTPSEPAARFEIRGNGVSANELERFGVSRMGVTARGSYESEILRIDSAAATNDQGLDITASGTIPLSGTGVDFSAEGTGPLALGERFVQTRGTSLEGTARFNIHLAGSLSQPQATGLLSVNDAAIADPLSNLRLTNVGLLAGFQGNTVSINTFSATVGGGGTASASGTVGLSPDLPADIAITLDNASYTDGRTVSARANGTLRLSGSLAGDPLLSGTITLLEAEITIPESVSGDGALFDVRHVAPPAPVQRTLDRLREASPAPRPDARPSVLQLDITVTAANRLFVRGRGIDAELGGSLRLTGPATGIRPVGSFSLRRGRINIVGRRIVFSEGSVRLVGDLDPFVNFTASTTADGIEANIRVTGRASDPTVVFSSQPELPQDEVLAHIIFGKSMTELSPVQIARLAAIVTELTGGGDSSLLGNLRSSTGLDELDVVSDSSGSAAVRAGRYISDNVYLGIQAGQETEATINLDITDNLKARGAANSKGDSSLGIFFERDY